MAEAVGVLIILLLLVGSGWLVRRSWRNGQLADRRNAARWRPQTEIHGPVTCVFLARGYYDWAGEYRITERTDTLVEIQNHDPEFDTKLHEAMAEGNNQAAARNSEIVRV